MSEHVFCTATHPDQPNHDGHARGRKMHLIDGTGRFKKMKCRDKEYTLCGMLVDEARPLSGFEYSTIGTRGLCQTCRSELNKLINFVNAVTKERKEAANNDHLQP